MPKLPNDASNEKLVADTKSLESELAELKAKLASVVPGKADGSTPLPGDGRVASEATVEEVGRAQILRDPWSGQNAMRILSHPRGRRLQWINPEGRKRRGLRGWTPVSYDDPIGRELYLYVTDPPSRMLGGATVDNIVRRGDAILCWIDEGIWQKRQNDRTDKANRHLKPAKRHFGPNAVEYGEGLEDDPNPRARTAPGFVSSKTLKEYRRNAQGTVQDASIGVPGRAMFDPREEG